MGIEIKYKINMKITNIDKKEKREIRFKHNGFSRIITLLKYDNKVVSTISGLLHSRYYTNTVK